MHLQIIKVLGQLTETFVEHGQHLIFGADVIVVWDATEAMEMHALGLIACIRTVNFNAANYAHEENA